MSAHGHRLGQLLRLVRRLLTDLLKETSIIGLNTPTTDTSAGLPSTTSQASKKAIRMLTNTAKIDCFLSHPPNACTIVNCCLLDVSLAVPLPPCSLFLSLAVCRCASHTCSLFLSLAVCCRYTDLVLKKGVQRVPDRPDRDNDDVRGQVRALMMSIFPQCEHHEQH